MDKRTIASRCSGTLKGIYKSYIKNIKLVEVREIPEHITGRVEKDYTFEHKGKKYRINQHIVPDKDGIVKYSCQYKYEAFEI